MLEMYEDLWLQKRDLEQRLEEHGLSLDMRVALQQSLGAVDKALGLVQVEQDRWIEQMEAEFEEGLDPDLGTL